MKMYVALPLFGLALLCLGVHTQQVVSDCPDGWLRWQTYCYLFHNTSTATWEDAIGECHDRMGHLLRVESQDEFFFVKKALMVYPSDAYWTALNSIGHQRAAGQSSSGALAAPAQTPKQPVFMWGDDAYPLDVVVGNNWDKEPDNTAWDDCVAVDVQGSCSVTNCNARHAFICEIQKQQSEVCPGYWVSLSFDSNMCYSVSNASDWSTTVTWDEARKRCQTMMPFQDTRAAQLIAVTSQQVQNFLESQLSMLYYGRQLFWTGLNDKSSEGTFIWAGNTGTPYQGAYLKWRQEPNNLGGQENCGVLQPGGRWGDRNCEDQVNFACRLALPDTPALYNMGCGTWSRAGRKCAYIYSRPPSNWQDARSFCQAQGGDLLKFDSQDDVAWLTSQATTRMSLPGYWIGLNDISTEGTFVWADGSSSDPLLTPWDHEPNGLGWTEMCAAMAYSGDFIDLNCWKHYAGTICEYPGTMCSASQGWYGHGGSCYLIDRVKWRLRREAKQFCHDQSPAGTGRLLALNTQDEKDWLVQQLGKQLNGTMTFWTDLRLVGKIWHWTRVQDDDPETISQLVTWIQEPNNWAGNEDCVSVNVNGGLNDANCQTKQGFVCTKWAPGFSAAATHRAAVLPALVLALSLICSRFW